MLQIFSVYDLGMIFLPWLIVNLFILTSSFNLKFSHGSGYVNPRENRGLALSLSPLTGLNSSRSFSYEFGEKKLPSEKVMSLWNNWTKGRRGLIVFFFPSVFAQVCLICNMGTFLMDRFTQYLQPGMVFVSFVLLNPYSIRVIRNSIFGSVFIGSILMLYDTFRCGAMWSPMTTPEEESYAVVTGASSGLGKALAERLYNDGYNLILIARNETALLDLKAKMLGTENKIRKTCVTTAVGATITLPSSTTSSSSSSLPSSFRPLNSICENNLDVENFSDDFQVSRL